MTDRNAILDELKYRDLHDDLIACVMHINMRGAADVVRELGELKAKGFEPDTLHEKCVACEKWRTIKAPRAGTTVCKHGTPTDERCPLC